MLTPGTNTRRLIGEDGSVDFFPAGRLLLAVFQPSVRHALLQVITDRESTGVFVEDKS